MKSFTETTHQASHAEESVRTEHARGGIAELNFDRVMRLQTLMELAIEGLRVRNEVELEERDFDALQVGMHELNDALSTVAHDMNWQSA